MHGTRKAGFLHMTLFIICAIFLWVVGVYHIGKRIPTGDFQITDSVADRYQEAGIEKAADRSYDSYETGDMESETRARLQAERAAELRESRYRPAAEPAPGEGVVSDPQYGSKQPIDSEPIQVPDQQDAMQSQIAPLVPPNVFTSKINNRISFQYPADAAVTERKASTNSEDTTIVFTIKGSDNRIVSMTYDKVTSGCFDPIRAFAIDPESSIDYRIVSPPQALTIEGKYKAQRTDEEIGNYIYAGSDPERPFIYTSNICVQTAIPTRLRLSSVHFNAGEQGLLSSVYDGILANISL